MTASHPLPAEGGSYIRHADGSLTRIDGPAPEDAAPPPAPALEPEAPEAPKPPAPKPGKATVKGE